MKKLVFMTALLMSASISAKSNCIQYASGDEKCEVDMGGYTQVIWTAPDGTQEAYRKKCWLMHGTLRCVSW